MAKVGNPYTEQKAQLGVIAAGLTTLKSEKGLLKNAAFSELYNAVERHHMDLKLAHLTGKEKDLLELASKDTKFYNILIKMLCEIKLLPTKKEKKETLNKVHNWYMGNKHTLAQGPKFGKSPSKIADNDKLPKGYMKSRTFSAKTMSSQGKSMSPRSSSKTSKKLSPKKSNAPDDSIQGNTDTVSVNPGPPSEPASSRLSLFGNDFMTNRFMMDLPSQSKLSFHLESPFGKSTSEWEGIDFDRIGEDEFAHHSVPNSSPQSQSASPRSSRSNVSSGADVGSADLMDFQSDMRRRLSRGPTSGGSGFIQMSENQSSSDGQVIGLQNRMIHPIASLVNPHAKLAENIAFNEEQKYYQEQMNIARPRGLTSRVHSAASSRGGKPPDLNDHIPALQRPFTAKEQQLNAFNNFKSDQTFGQDILSRYNDAVRFRPERKVISAVMPPISYTALQQTDPDLHSQSLEDFYATMDSYKPGMPGERPWMQRIQSAPGTRGVLMRGEQKYRSGAKSSQSSKAWRKKSVGGKHFQQSPQNEKIARVPRGTEAMMYNYTTHGTRTKTPVKIEQVVSLIDNVTEDMGYFREKLAPAPMPGFHQPASTGVPSQPLSRPVSTSTRSRSSRPVSSQPRARSPSPQGRPGTPDLLMKPDALSPDVQQEQTAGINKAIDWRGKVTPDIARARSKTRFGGHSYVQKTPKTSLRTAGGSPSRPKTAPMRSALTPRFTPRDKDEEKSDRVPQAASHTVRGVTEEEMDKIMSIQHLLGTSEDCDRYDSIGSLYLDEDFLRSINARYSTRSAMSHLTSESQNREFLTIVGPTPRYSPEVRTPRKHSARRPGPHQLCEEEEVRFGIEEQTESTGADTAVTGLELQTQPGETEVGASQESAKGTNSDRNFNNDRTVAEDDPSNIENAEVTNVNASACLGLAESDFEDPEADVGINEVSKANTPVPEIDGEFGDEEFNNNNSARAGEGDGDHVNYNGTGTERSITSASNRSGKVDLVPIRELVFVGAEDHGDDVHIEITALPASGRPHSPGSDIDPGAALQDLAPSDTWSYKPGKENEHDMQDINATDKNNRYNKHLHRRRPHSAFDSRISKPGYWAKSLVKTENYCFHCLPEAMTSKVGRSAGRMPGGAQSPAGQVLRMSRRQNEIYKKAPPVRTPPSIPSQHHTRTMPSPRQGQQYISELEHHARKINSPRHFMEQVVELRSKDCRSAPPGTRLDADDMNSSLSVVSLRNPNNRAQTAPGGPATYRYSSNDGIQQLPATLEEEGDLEANPDDTGIHVHMPSTAPPRTSRTQLPKPPSTAPSLSSIGRPIPQVSHIPDPDEVGEAVQVQKEAKAAVDIQRIFRGYVCRNSYRKLIWENRKDMEDRQHTVMEIQKEHKKHLGRKAKIYQRPPLDPELLQWAKDFKEIQTTYKGKRLEKMDSMAKEMLANQQKAKSKIEVIGPHVEIYDIYHPKDMGPSKRDMHKAAVRMQKHARGFLVRRRFQKLRRKATFCGSTWEKIVKEYKQLLVRVQRWHGVEKPTTPFSLKHMHDYMDMRRRYESQFDKKSFAGELELSELNSFFRECDLYPSGAEIEDGLDVTTNGQALRKGNGLKKGEALNLLFYIYVPPGTGLTNTRQSTWMNPIINGVEAKKLIGDEFVEHAPLQACADLVIASRRGRKEKEDAEIERQRKLKREQDGYKSDDSDVEKKKPPPLKAGGTQKLVFGMR